jgi:hypothetical protein
MKPVATIGAVLVLGHFLILPARGGTRRLAR